MSAIKQIQIGGGTTYDVNDLRVATSVVTTATHVLATNSAVSAINPIAMASLASVLGAQNNNGWTIRIQGQTSGSRFYKIYTSPNSMPFRFLGRGSANGRHTDTTIVIGNGVHEGYKGLAHGATGDTYLSYFYTDDGTQATLYVKTAGAIQARVISSMPMTGFEEINALPEGATEIVPISVPDAISTQNLSSLASALGAYDMGWRMKIPSLQGIQYYKITPSSNKVFVYHLSGCSALNSGTLDIELRHGRDAHEGRKLPYNTTAGNFDSDYFQYWYEGIIMYLMVGSFASITITAPIAMTVEQVAEIPSTATKVTLT